MNKKKDSRSYEELVGAVRRGDSLAESTLYENCRKYFYEHVQILPHIRYEAISDIFQEAFLVIWTEIQNGKIFIKDGRIARINKYNDAAFLKCSLNSFLMAIARNLHLKELRTDGPAFLVDIEGMAIMGDSIQIEPTEEEIQRRIVDEEISKMSSHCREILTLFYVKGLSLEKILFTRSENTSKDGLKTSKSKCLKQLKNNADRRRKIYEC